MAVYHIILKDSTFTTDLDHFAKETRSKIRKYKNLPNHITLECHSSHVETLLSYTFITSISEDAEVQPTETRQIDNINGNWGLDRIDQRNLPLDGVYRVTRGGARVNVYLLDTGIKKSSPELGVRVIPIFDAFNAPGSTIWCEDTDGHGTQVAGIIGGYTHGVASEVQLLTVKILNPGGTVSSVLAGIDAVLGHYNAQPPYGSNNYRPAIANLNFTTISSIPRNNALDQAVLSLVNAGITTIVPAGNDSSDAGSILAVNGSPAGAGVIFTPDTPGSKIGAYTFNDSKPIVVGSIGRTDQITPTSNVGAAIDIFAPGESIWSLGIKNPNDLVVKSGTSMSAAFVTGVCALFLDTNTSALPADVRVWLNANCTTNTIDFSSETDYKKTSSTVPSILIDNYGTPNKIVFEPYQNSNITWTTSSGLLFSIKEGDSTDSSITAISSLGDPITYSVIDGLCPFVLNPATGSLEGPATQVNNTTTFTFTVQASVPSGDNSTRAFAIEVTNVNQKPYWVTPSGSLGLYNEGQFLQYQFVAKDPDNAIITFSLLSGSLPFGMAISLSGLLSGTIVAPDNQDQYVFSVRMSDGTFVSDRVFSIEVNNTPTPPTWLTDSNIGVYVQGETVNFKINVLDYDNNGISFSMPQGQGAIAYATTNISNGVQSVIVTNPGSGYQSPPTVSFYAGGGAAATAYISGGILDHIDVTAIGANYKNTPAIELIGGGGSGAIVEAVTSSGNLTEINVLEGGNGWVSAPAVLINTPTGATAITSIDSDQNGVSSITVTTPGSGYQFSPSVIITPVTGGALPVGLQLTDDGYIRGNISLSAPPGTYNFIIRATDGKNNIIEKTFVMALEPFTETTTFVSIIWNTPAGNLGDIVELTPSYLSVSASASDNSTVNYTLAPNSGGLPLGLNLDVNTGNLVGFPYDVLNKTPYTFTVRAYSSSIPTIYSDRTFTLTVLNQFSDLYSNATVLLTGPYKLNWVSYLLNNISKDSLFNSTDPNWGIPTHPKLLIVGGLNRVDDATFWSALKEIPQDPPATGFIPFSTYHQKLNVIIGSLELAVARDSFNNVVYEVIYRKVYDPTTASHNGKQFYVGGFDSSGQPQQITYPHALTTKSGVELVYPPSLLNFRQDLIDDIGLAGSEYLPLWMTSQQTAGDDSTKLGWIPAIECAFLKPGTGQAILEVLQLKDDSVAFKNATLVVDRYYYNRLNLILTGFDDSTEFDFGFTNFDAHWGETGKYFKFPPGEILP